MPFFEKWKKRSSYKIYKKRIDQSNPNYFSKLLIVKSQKTIYLPLVYILISKGADINYKNKIRKPFDKISHLHISFIYQTIKFGNITFLKKLKDKGLNFKQRDSRGNNILHCIAHMNDDIKAEIIQFLIENINNINAKNFAKTTPLDSAFSKQNKKLFQILVKGLS